MSKSVQLPIEVIDKLEEKILMVISLDSRGRDIEVQLCDLKKIVADIRESIRHRDERDQSVKDIVNKVQSEFRPSIM